MSTRIASTIRIAVIATIILVAVSPLPVIAQDDNDNFINATEISSLPFEDFAGVEGKTIEPEEPTSSMCLGPGFSATWSYWYKITPSIENVYILDVQSYINGTASVNIYSTYPGGSFPDLEFNGCMGFPEYGGYDTFEFEVLPVYTYYIQISGDQPSGDLWMSLDQRQSLTADFRFNSSGPASSKFDTITFTDTSFDPLEVGIQTYEWDFGDGVSETSNMGMTTHRYNFDGSYTVAHKVTTFDGREASISKVVSISTHDVVITRIAVPDDAKSGQTRKIDVYIANLYYPETVFISVEKYPKQEGGFSTLLPSNIDYPTLLPVSPMNKPIVASFDYTFTPWDVEVGKVTFVAKVRYLNWLPPYNNDCCKYDDELRSTPVRLIK